MVLTTLYLLLKSLMWGTSEPLLRTSASGMARSVYRFGISIRCGLDGAEIEFRQ